MGQSKGLEMSVSASRREGGRARAARQAPARRSLRGPPRAARTPARDPSPRPGCSIPSRRAASPHLPPATQGRCYRPTPAAAPGSQPGASGPAPSSPPSSHSSPPAPLRRSLPAAPRPALSQPRGGKGCAQRCAPTERGAVAAGREGHQRNDTPPTAARAPSPPA